MPDKDIAEKTGWIVKVLLEYFFNSAVGNPWKTDSNGGTISITKNGARKLTEGFKYITESEFNDIFEGLKNSLFATMTARGYEDHHSIRFTGLPGFKRLE